MFVDPGFLIVADGAGRRAVKQPEVKEQMKSTPGSCKQEIMDLLTETLECNQPMLQRPVLMLADSMGRCIPATDSVIRPMVKDTYPFDLMAEDVASGLVSLQHRWVVIWSGAHQVGTAEVEEIMADLKALVNIIRVKNKNIQICVSSVVPQPKDQRNLQSKIATFNNALKDVVAQCRADRIKVQFVPTHLIYLDEQLDILRPITDNYEDGFHLNIHGAHRLRQFWLRELGLAK